MGEAFIKGLIEGGATANRIIVYDVDEEKLKKLKKTYGVETASSSSEVAKGSTVLFLAVKPQVLEGVLREISQELSKDSLLVSMAAGFPIERIERAVGRDKKIIRIMPNIMVKVKKGSTAICANGNVSPQEIEKVEELLRPISSTYRIDEKLFNAITAVSGSSPAFIFLIIEAMCDGAVRLGLSREMAKSLVVEVLEGAAAMAREEHPEVLKGKVSSPAGTTIEGLAELERRGVRGALIDALMAAKKRGDKLSGS